ncbi:alanine racemase [Sporosarcina sp. Te-1]|uniref:alanine racemase n=1 Tax=Sporosarcina sp. Te-1 TaxID=2818390 RepID=UPI001A9FCD25|nr:alanine racemase [Sporosarcina sp. Te-1]QTD39575.1 alanine racemase [Sporosarcina sp. Te-1]
MKEANYRPTVATVKLDAIKRNVQNLKAYLKENTEVIAVVKADGYGHGDVETARAALEAGAAMVAVATPDEAVRLREGGISADILVMGPSPVEFASQALQEDITVTVSDASWVAESAERLYDKSGKLKIHIKVDSGMGRIGLRSKEQLQSLLNEVGKSDKIMIDGIFTHFACADESDPSPTEEQFETFIRMVEEMPEKPRLVHASNSAATLLYPDFALDAVRFGISLYGVAPSPYTNTKLPFPLERAMTIETELAYVKLLPKGNRISYGGTYETSEDEWIGTIPIGYADGFRRGLRGQEVLIQGERMPIVGTICMDQCMVKLSRELPVGEKVTLIGRQGEEEIMFEEWAVALGTIPYEIMVSISKRIPRIY